MVTAISAVANGGYLMQPYVVARQLDENNNVISETQPHIRRQVISEETAAEVTDMMEAVVTSGTGKSAYVTGYRVAGKTGTSQKLGSDGEYVASFGCFAPANDPEIAVLILVDEPEGQINGGQICTPVAAQVVEKTLEYMGVERQYNDKELEKLDTLTPSLVGKSTEDALALLNEKGFKVKVVGEGEKVISQMPSYNHSVPQNGIIVLYTEKDVERVTVEVPDLTMMTLSAVNKYALSTGLNIKVSGNALNAAELISYDQNIEAGQTVEYGSTITVYFKSDTGVNDYAG
jgi:stage V sporulation protein D (sporulation-specific penicillin-binding protein)